MPDFTAVHLPSCFPPCIGCAIFRRMIFFSLQLQLVQAAAACDWGACERGT
jgi:hypothetical protein